MSDNGKFNSRGEDRRQNPETLETAKEIEERRMGPRRLADEMAAGADRRGLINQFDQLSFAQVNETGDLMRRLNEMIYHAMEDARPMLDSSTREACQTEIATIIERDHALSELRRHLTHEDRAQLLAPRNVQEQAATAVESLENVLLEFNQTFNATPLYPGGLRL